MTCNKFSVEAVVSNMSKMNFIGKIPEADWEAKQVIHLQELEEARTRATQMEKTMRWWSDCTANWREKWSKVRNERNIAREEIKLMQTKLDSAIKESNTFRRQKQNLEIHNEQMRKELDQLHILLLKHVGQWNTRLLEEEQKVESCKKNSYSFFPLFDNHSDVNGKDSGIEEYVLNDGPVNKHAVEILNDFPSLRSNPIDDLSFHISDVSGDPCHAELIRYKLSEVQLKLDEMSKTVVTERVENQGLHKIIGKLESELMTLKEKHEDLKLSKQDAVRDLSQLKDTHNNTVTHIKADLLNESTFREDVDRRLADVRAQLERLQVENASEWGKRERVETEKLSLERENKKLRAELRDALDRLERRIKSQPTADNELRSLQLELADKNKELNDLKQAHIKVKKILTDKTTELNHAERRIEQYETEVKKLRLRIEELKRELATAEDEVDNNNNNVRKLQRSNDDLQEQVDNLHVQIQYLQNRLKRISILKIQNGFSDEQTDDDNNT